MSPRLRLIIVSLAVVVVIIIGVSLWRNGTDGRLFASGTVEATEAQLGFQSPGRIEAIAVQEGDRVDANTVLALLDTAEVAARKRQADAQLAATQALLNELESGSRPEEVAQAQAAHDAAKERHSDAQRDWERTKSLFESGAVSREALDKAATQLEIAKNQHQQAVEQLRLVRIGPRSERIAAQRAQVAQSEATAAALAAQLRNMTIRAPFAGLVTVRHREPGEIVPAGSPVLTIMNPDDRWVRIYIPETRIGAVRIGQPAAITTDTDPDKTYRGAVVHIASEAEFTPKTVQTAEERVKLVFAVKVRIVGDPTSDLKPGMPADVLLESQTR